MSDFVNLRNYSENTFLTGVAKAPEYAKIAKKKNLPAIALTDKNSTHGVIKFYKACQAEEGKSEAVKPLIGVNWIIEEKNENILMFPKDIDGYVKYNLIVSALKLWTKESFFDFTKADLNGCFYVISKETYLTKDSAFFKEFLGEDVFFEFQPWYGKEYLEKLTSEVGSDRIVFTNPTYFIPQEDLETKLTIKAIKDKKTISEITDDFSELYFKSKNQLKDSLGFDIDNELFDSIVGNTAKIYDNVDMQILFWVNLIPKFDIEGKDLEIFNLYSDRSKLKLSSDEWYLRYLCYSNFQYRYNYELSLDQVIELVNKDDFQVPEAGLTKTSIDELKKLSKIGFPKEKQAIIDSFDEYGKNLIYRLEYELYVIHNMGFDAYFLIVSDYINKGAKERGIAVGPGRGSAAWSIAAYLSKITDIDPIKYGLLFERFLNPSRISMPDVDTDFADINRADVIEYCSKKYGRDQVTSVCTFGTMAARSSIKDVGRALGIDAKEMNRLAQLISSKPGVKLQDEYEDNEKFRMAIDSNDMYKQVYDLAIKIEGHMRQLWVHACATIIAPRALTNFSVIQYPPKRKESEKSTTVWEDESADYSEDAVITQLEAHDLEDLGLLKMDFLGLKNMTVLQNTLKLIKERKWIDIDLAKLELDDKKTYDEVFSKGETTGVFQFESNGMRKYLKGLQADKFEELIAMVSLYRPGPLEFIPSFIDRKHWREPIKYLNAVLEELMKETYWHCVYQEQIMLMSQIYAGYSMAEADELRKGIGKKNKAIIAKHEEKFVNGAVANNHDHDEAENIYKKVIVPAGSYSFNKSHAACYALIAYWTAFFKVHYPSEYITACFMSDYDDQERVDLFTREFIRLGGKVLHPDINKSDWNYTLEKEGVIRMGLATIKGIGVVPAQAIVEERNNNGDFKDFKDFLSRGKEYISKKILDGLVGAGSLDQFVDQNAVLANMSELTDFAKGKIKKKKKVKIEQKSIFDIVADEPTEEIDTDSDQNILYPNESVKATSYEKATRQLAALWVMVSTHPLSWLSKYVKSAEKNREIIFGTVNNNYVAKEDKRVNIFWYISDFIISKNSAGRETMTIKIMGLDYEIRANCYAEKTEEYRYDIEKSIGKFIDAEWSFGVSTYGRTLNIEKLMVIDPIKHIERMKVRWLYDEKEVADISVPYLYNFETVNPYIKLSVAINAIDDKDKLIGYLKDFKEFLQKQEPGAYHVLLRDIKGTEKDTKFYIKDYKTVIGFFKNVKKWARIFIEDKEQKIPKDSEA